jgi:hypothetical protein
MSTDPSFSINNIIPIGVHGLVNHVFSGPNGFSQASYHNSIGIMSFMQLNYKNFSFGPWGVFDYLTRGILGGDYSVSQV